MRKSVNDREIMAVVEKVSEVLRDTHLDRITCINVLDQALATVMVSSVLSDDEAANFLEANTELIIALMRHHRRTWSKHLATN